MDSTALVLILLSALLHAGWNAMVKGVGERFALLAAAHVLMVVALTPFLAGPAIRQLDRDPSLMLPLAGAAVLFALYHLFLAIGYGTGDLSMVYPLTTMAPALVPVWAYLYLGERVKGWGYAGIAMVLLGAWAVQSRALTVRGILEPLRGRHPAVGPALAAAFFYSLGSVVDKAGISRAEVLPYTYLLMAAMCAVEVPMAAGLRMGLVHFVRERWRYAAATTLVLAASFVAYRYGLKVCAVSYASSVRQVNALFGVLLGIALYREPFGRVRLTATALIVAGVIVIKILG